MTDNPQLYTVIAPNGDVIGTHMTAAEAACAKLNHDGADFEIRRDDYSGNPYPGNWSRPYYVLWTRKQAANQPWSASLFSCFAHSPANAEAEIFRQVIKAKGRSEPRVVKQEEHDAALAALAAEREG